MDEVIDQKYDFISGIPIGDLWGYINKRLIVTKEYNDESRTKVTIEGPLRKVDIAHGGWHGNQIALQLGSDGIVIDLTPRDYETSTYSIKAGADDVLN